MKIFSKLTKKTGRIIYLIKTINIKLCRKSENRLLIVKFHTVLNNSGYMTYKRVFLAWMLFSVEDVYNETP